MIPQTRLARRTTTLVLGGITLATTACAGPRVGEVVGAPATTSMTVQARVVSATPVVGQVTVPRQVCYDEWRQDPPRSSGAGALMGAIAGGAVGNAVGKGAGKALATGLGIFGGAIVGDRIENDGRPGTGSTVRRCEQQAAYENRVVAYNVVYEYGGQRYSTQTTQEPGATIPLRVTLSPVVAGPSYNQGAATPYSPVAPAIYTPAPAMVFEEPAYPGWRHHRHWD